MRQFDNYELTTLDYALKYYLKHNELHPSPKSRYEQFQEWLNECPVEIANYLDYTDTFEITFRVPLEQSAESITKEQLKSIKGDLL